MSKRYAQFCDKNGHTLLGSDSLIWIDGRWNQKSKDEHVKKVRDGYKKNFPHKFESMTHYVHKGVIRRVW